MNLRKFILVVSLGVAIGVLFLFTRRHMVPLMAEVAPAHSPTEAASIAPPKTPGPQADANSDAIDFAKAVENTQKRLVRMAGNVPAIDKSVRQQYAPLFEKLRLDDKTYEAVIAQMVARQLMVDGAVGPLVNKYSVMVQTKVSPTDTAITTATLGSDKMWNQLIAQAQAPEEAMLKATLQSKYEEFHAYDSTWAYQLIIQNLNQRLGPANAVDPAQQDALIKALVAEHPDGIPFHADNSITLGFLVAAAQIVNEVQFNALLVRANVDTKITAASDATLQNLIKAGWHGKPQTELEPLGDPFSKK